MGLSFDWVSGQNGAKGKTGIDFRDSYGRLIAAFCASTDEKTGALRLRSSAAGTAAESSAFSSTCEPSWSEAQITPGNRYHMELWADFREKTVSVVVSDEDGKTIARIDEAKTEAGGLAQMIACNYWTMDSKGNRYPGDRSARPHHAAGCRSCWAARRRILRQTGSRHGLLKIIFLQSIRTIDPA